MLNDKGEVKQILNKLEEMFPNASCELNYNNIFELLIAVVLSAQTTDKSVNIVTVKLFEKYPDALSLSKAEFADVKNIIARLGLSTTKAKNIINLSKVLVEVYDGVVPKTLEELTRLPGVGRKTANVVLSEGYHINRIAVDTHVERVSKRLGLAEFDDDVLKVENKLMNLIDEDSWHHSHHLLLFFGRYFCLAKKPKCEECFFKNRCTGYKCDKNPQEKDN